MKRTRRGHDPSGVCGTAQGKLTPRCRACPQDGRNLPKAGTKLTGMRCLKTFDCNFRLINRNVSSAANDPIIGNGLGYFVNHAKYTQYLGDFQLLRVSGYVPGQQEAHEGPSDKGVGGMTCARHNIYCNMDFILFSAILNMVIFYLILSYHIACQYGKNFWSRMALLPKGLHIRIPQPNVWFKVPNFHLPAHKLPCHSPFSFHWMWGARWTHAETIEQNWEFTNGAAASMKMMG
ncbi:hypothetical protein B0H10DRAFT_2167702 [Mycena sp. CBHHK59/15]|nr:hypothetical protein B0H10DRAFT_2167702 [Mycena sp. CBHHK59/15]